MADCATLEKRDYSTGFLNLSAPVNFHLFDGGRALYLRLRMALAYLVGAAVFLPELYWHRRESMRSRQEKVNEVSIGVVSDGNPGMPRGKRLRDLKETMLKDGYLERVGTEK